MSETGPKRISVLLVDDQDLVRGGVAMMIDAEDDLEVIGQASSGPEAVRLAAELEPDVVLMDIQMPGDFDGIEATRLVTEAGHSKVIVLTTFGEEDLVFPALRNGASGYLLKVGESDSLVRAVRSVHGGESLLSPAVTREVIKQFTRPTSGASFRPSLVEQLTDREREVLALVARGLTNAEIAKELFVSECTAKTHVSNILTKTGMRDRVQAVSLAYESGVVRAGEVVSA